MFLVLTDWLFYYASVYLSLEFEILKFIEYAITTINNWPKCSYTSPKDLWIQYHPLRPCSLIVY